MSSRTMPRMPPVEVWAASVPVSTNACATMPQPAIHQRDDLESKTEPREFSRDTSSLNTHLGAIDREKQDAITK